MSGGYLFMEFEIIHIEETSSTNDYARELAQDVQESFLVYSDIQTKGRGKAGRSWFSSKNNLAFSLVLKEKIAPSKLHQFVFLSAVAMAEILEELGANISLKWPNDILINDKKVAGILVESIIANKEFADFIIIGIGLNIIDIPSDVFYPTTSLKLENLKLYNKKDYIDRFIAKFFPLYENLKLNGFNQVKEKWLARAKLNTIITLNDDGTKVTGIFNGIDDKGNIIIDSSSYKNGDITLDLL